MATYFYSQANVDCLVKSQAVLGPNLPANFEVKGLAEGEQTIIVRRNSPVFTTKVDAYGDRIANLNRDQTGTIQIKLHRAAKENVYFQSWLNFNESNARAGSVGTVSENVSNEQGVGNGNVIFGLDIKLVDNMGNDQVTAARGIIESHPTFIRGKSLGEVVWTISFDKISFAKDFNPSLGIQS